MLPALIGSFTGRLMCCGRLLKGPMALTVSRNLGNLGQVMILEVVQEVMQTAL